MLILALVFIHTYLQAHNNNKMTQDLKKEHGWYAKFNLKPLNDFKRIYYGVLFYHNRYPERQVDFGRKDIEQFIKATKAKVNYVYAHKFYAVYLAHFGRGLFNLKVKDWTYEIFLPMPELYQGSKELKQKYYYFTLFHELIHWTGCQFNLKRFTLEKPSKVNELSRTSEEIIAAFGCFFLMKKFSLVDDEIDERAMLYIKDYASALVYELSVLNIITLRENWVLSDYLKNDAVVYQYMSNLMQKAKEAVEYLESFQK